ncbi:sugar ABC transporter ATP-binding protein [Cutibacterium sp. V947]|uniref:sugar ABC transporter ATP-binding protein n=1 Tax=unclassified Cutibacterium TaxID=2649671 RepID=UPI003EE1D062
MAAPVTETTKTGTPVLEIRNIDKRYGGVHALKDVSWKVYPGEVCGLAGENGAGKSTLIKMISGAESPDTGTVLIDGSELVHGNTKAALAAGVSAVYQEPQLFADLTVAENVFLGRELTKVGRVAWAEQQGRVADLLARLNLSPDIMHTRVGDLAVGEQQLLSIAKAFVADVRLLILDEPSAILTNHDIERLFATVRGLREENIGVIYISHRLDELTEITDRVTVMRDGAIVGDYPTGEMSPAKIATAMVGDKFQVADRGERPSHVSDEVILSVKDLGCGDRLQSANFELHRGEVLGVYGLIGSGATELARCLFGILRPDHGEIAVDGFPRSFSSPRCAMDAGITLLPGNRKTQGVFLPKSLAFNLSSSHLRYFSKGGVFDHKRETSVMREMIDRLRIKAPGPDTVIGALSGGNQQKVVMARQLVEEAKILVAEEPTQGVDVGAKAEIHRLILDHVAEGHAAVVLSTDLEEIRFLCDRIIVLRRGVTEQELPADVSAACLLSAASGETSDGEVVTGEH